MKRICCVCGMEEEELNMTIPFEVLSKMLYMCKTCASIQGIKHIYRIIKENPHVKLIDGVFYIPLI